MKGDSDKKLLKSGLKFQLRYFFVMVNLSYTFPKMLERVQFLLYLSGSNKHYVRKKIPYLASPVIV